MRLIESENYLKNKIDSTLLSAISDNITLMAPTNDTVFKTNAGGIGASGADRGRTIALTKKLDAKGLVDLAANSGIRHIIQHTETRFVREIHIAAQLIEHADNFLMAPKNYILNDQIP